MRPEFWSDPTVARMPDPVRLFYIGLWNMADDAGWLSWETAQVGALLYPFRAVARREREIVEWLAVLAAEDRVKRYDCGCVEIPKLTEHQRVAGTPSFRARDAHLADHPDTKPYAVSPEQRLRENVIARDGMVCRFDGASVTSKTLVLAHLDPRGPRNVDNLVVACRRCNWRQGDKGYVEAGMTLLDPVAPKGYEGPTRSPVEGGVSRGEVEEGYTRPLASPPRATFPPIGSRGLADPLKETA